MVRNMAIDVSFVKAYIVQHISQVRNPQDVARQLQVSYHSLRKDFRRQAGMTLGQFIRLARVQRARYLLATTNLCCFEISYEAGFSREDVAARIFKQETNMTMLDYRKQCATFNRGDYSVAHQDCSGQGDRSE